MPILIADLALDFVNPFMPGAVRFGAGGLHVIEAHIARAGSGLVATHPTREIVVDRPVLLDPAGRLAPRAKPGRHARPRILGAPTSSSDPAVPADEH